LSIPFVFLYISCENSASPPPPKYSEIRELPPEHKLLSRITDDILVALATRNYTDLDPFVPIVVPPLTGQQAAQMLLGDQIDSIMLDRWNAETIRVSLTPDQLSATTKVNVTYRRSPNRPPRRREFTFRFARPSRRDRWRLKLQN
jgi:hypothetical protein